MEGAAESNTPPETTDNAVPFIVRLSRCFGLLAVAAAIAAAAVCGTRLIGSPDIGYHLDYGYRFLDTGTPVETSPAVYTVENSRPDTADETLPPCCWRDAEGAFHFPNANWVSQVLFAGIHSRWDFTGLSLATALLVFSIAAVAAATMIRGGVHPAWAAAGIILIILCGYERFVLRPELFAAALLSVQLFILLDSCSNGGPGPIRIALLAATQVALVNMHSLWILGPAMTTAFLADRLARLLFRTATGRGRTDGAGRLGILFLLQLAACFLNPWTWRLGALPVETAVFFLRNNITAAHFTEGGHPWSTIGEFFSPFDAGFAGQTATWAYYGLLGAAGTALVSALYARKWDALFLIAGLVVFSMTMRRNIAPAAILLVPISLRAMGLAVTRLKERSRSVSFSLLSGLAAVLVTALSAWLLISIVSNRFYYARRSPHRFGIGPANMNLPLGACRFISTERPAGRLWTDYDTSSNIRFFASPRPEVPVLTNTWAYPVETMEAVLDVIRGKKELGTAAIEFDFQVAVMRVGRFTAEPIPGREHVPIALAMSADPRWVPVYLDARHVVFVMGSGENTAFVKKHRIPFDSAWARKYVARIRKTDPVPAQALLAGGNTLSLLGINRCAIVVLREAVAEDPELHEAWYCMGVCCRRLSVQHLRGDFAREATRCFKKCLEIKPDFEPALRALKIE